MIQSIHPSIPTTICIHADYASFDAYYHSITSNNICIDDDGGDGDDNRLSSGLNKLFDSWHSYCAKRLQFPVCIYCNRIGIDETESEALNRLLQLQLGASSLDAFFYGQKVFNIIKMINILCIVGIYDLVHSCLKYGTIDSFRSNLGWFIDSSCLFVFL